MMVNDGPCPCVIVMDLGARYANECIQTCRRIYRITIIYSKRRRFSEALNQKTLRTMHSAVVHPSHLMHLSLL